MLLIFIKRIIHVTVSIGIVCAIIKDDTIGVEKIISEADKLLYCAKNHGRNKVFSCEL
ncbi:diguanylate cyclase [Clostridium chromiireducens]|uniref:Diguanylate cyclase n=1 Tax=Clostridium chromiireducens TaxID=225345 RepID=A0A399IUV0_9CLOT|nr:diguanylate cyclase [Clostridium chromiireducens]